MSYDPFDEARDDWIAEISDQAISEFTMERLHSYYVANPTVMHPALAMLHEAHRLHKNEHYTAAVLFSASSIEIFLKGTILKPMIHGLIHTESLASVVVEKILGNNGYDINLLTDILKALAEINLRAIKRYDSRKLLIEECAELRRTRNKIIHSGCDCNAETAALSLILAKETYKEIVLPALTKLNLQVDKNGYIH